jgi:hypothetical protein
MLTPLLIWASVAASAPEWRVAEKKDGLTVELRDVEGSKFDEVRVSTVTKAASLEDLCDAVWGKGAEQKNEGDFKKRVILKETDDERLSYEQIKVSMASDRDFVMSVKKVSPASSGKCVVIFETTNDSRYPPDKEHVRIKAIRGNWVLEPAKDGGVAASYQVFSDPGGDVPALFVHGPQRAAAVSFFKTILQRAQKGSK